MSVRCAGVRLEVHCEELTFQGVDRYYCHISWIVGISDK
jgi:hypothetical protein